MQNFILTKQAKAPAMKALYRLTASVDDLSVEDEVDVIRLHRMLRPFLKNSSINKLDGTITCRHDLQQVKYVLVNTLHYDEMNNKYRGPFGDVVILRTPAHLEGNTIIQFV
jgi:hypothetical protein